MPIYEFRCKTCDSRFEEILRGADEAREVACPACGSAEVERLQSSFARAGCSKGEAFPSCSPRRGFS